ncbi:MAG TPA: hypothetical protein V6C97_12670, partial [Oculatellaceae cyanobacterium]
MQRNHYADREAELKKHKDDKDGSTEQGDDVLGKKKIADTSPFANDAPTRPEQANQSAENITNQMAQANGIGKAGEKTYETSQGAITGGEYTNKNGTFLVANNSEGQAVKYKVETNATTGAKTLVDQSGKGEALQVKSVETPAVRTGEANTATQSSAERQSSTGTPAPISDGQTQPPKHGTDATKQPPASVVGQTIDATPPSSAKPNAGDAPTTPVPVKTPTASEGAISTPPVKTVTDTPPPVQTHPAAPAPGGDGQIKSSSPTAVTGGIDSSAGQPQPIVKPGAPTTPVATSTEGQVVTSGTKSGPVSTISDSSPQPPAKTVPGSDSSTLQPKPVTAAPVGTDGSALQPKPVTAAPVGTDGSALQPKPVTAAPVGTDGSALQPKPVTAAPVGTDGSALQPKPVTAAPVGTDGSALQPKPVTAAPVGTDGSALQPKPVTAAPVGTDGSTLQPKPVTAAPVGTDGST